MDVVTSMTFPAVTFSRVKALDRFGAMTVPFIKLILLGTSFTVTGRLETHATVKPEIKIAPPIIRDA